MTIENVLRNYVNENLLFGDDSISYTDDDSFIEKGIIDSIAILELVMFVQESFELKIDDQEITPGHFDSIKNLAAFIRSKQNGHQ